MDKWTNQKYFSINILCEICIYNSEKCHHIGSKGICLQTAEVLNDSSEKSLYCRHIFFAESRRPPCFVPKVHIVMKSFFINTFSLIYNSIEAEFENQILNTQRLIFVQRLSILNRLFQK